MFDLPPEKKWQIICSNSKVGVSFKSQSFLNVSFIQGITVETLSKVQVYEIF